MHEVFLCEQFLQACSCLPGTGQCLYLPPVHGSSPPLQIQVIEDDRNNRGSEPFVTGVRGQVPPLVTTNFLVKDQGEEGAKLHWGSL